MNFILKQETVFIDKFYAFEIYYSNSNFIKPLNKDKYRSLLHVF